MASNARPEASQALSCPLLNLPPELRLLIYAYTHSIDLDLEYYWVYSLQDLGEAWASAPLVKLAGTCRLIAKEARGYVRSMPDSQREVLVDLSGADGPDRELIIRMRHLPCPMVDLRRVVVSYDFEKYKSTAYAFPADHHDSEAVDKAMSDMGFNLFSALYRLMTEAAVNESTYWKRDFWLQINGLQKRREGESYYGALRRVLEQPTTDPASAERLVRKFYSQACIDMPHIEHASNAQLAWFFEDIPLYLSV